MSIKEKCDRCGDTVYIDSITDRFVVYCDDCQSEGIEDLMDDLFPEIKEENPSE